MNKKGYTILFTVLTTSIILAIALGVSRISFTEAVLSSTSREGAYAFFAADTGLECALYNDLQNNVFIPPTTLPFECAAGPTITVGETPTPLDIPESSNRFFFTVDTAPDSCSHVYVYKDWVVDNETYTRIESFGYNKDCVLLGLIQTGNQPAGAERDLVERALRATYKFDIQLNNNQNPQPQQQGQSQ